MPTLRTTKILETDLAGSAPQLRVLVEADRATLPAAARDRSRQRAITALTLAVAPVTRAVPGLRRGIRRAERMSPTRNAWRER